MHVAIVITISRVEKIMNSFDITFINLWERPVSWISRLLEKTAWNRYYPVVKFVFVCCMQAILNSGEKVFFERQRNESSAAGWFRLKGRTAELKNNSAFCFDSELTECNDFNNFVLWELHREDSLHTEETFCPSKIQLFFIFFSRSSFLSSSMSSFDCEIIFHWIFFFSSQFVPANWYGFKLFLLIKRKTKTMTRGKNSLQINKEKFVGKVYWKKAAWNISPEEKNKKSWSVI